MRNITFTILLVDRDHLSVEGSLEEEVSKGPLVELSADSDERFPSSLRSLRQIIPFADTHIQMELGSVSSVSFELAEAEPELPDRPTRRSVSRFPSFPSSSFDVARLTSYQKATRT